MSESFPNKNRDPGSPDPTELGVRIRAGSGPFATGEPIIVRGAFRVDDRTRRTMENILEPRVVLIVTRCDEPLVWARPLEDGHNRLPTRFDPNAPIDPSFFAVGYFNLDLAAFCDRLEEGGRYWLMASFGDWVSERIQFAMKEAT